MAHLNWTDLTLDDLVNIVDYIAKDSVRFAKIKVKRIRIAERQLEKYQLSVRKVPESNIENIRELILGNYRIIYHIIMQLITFTSFA